jgi:hypothetical protein
MNVNDYYFATNNLYLIGVFIENEFNSYSIDNIEEIICLN